MPGTFHGMFAFQHRHARLLYETPGLQPPRTQAGLGAGASARKRSRALPSRRGLPREVVATGKAMPRRGRWW